MEDTERDPGGEMCSGTEEHRPGWQALEGKKTHALFIHFQADQHPSVSPRIRSGPVQNSPVLNARSSQRPTKMPVSMGTTIIQPSTSIWARRRATEGSPSRS